MILEAKEAGRVLSFEVPWLGDDFDAKRASEVLVAFERKLIGVDATRVCAEDGRMRLFMRVRGGADEDYLQRLWRRHLREENVRTYVIHEQGDDGPADDAHDRPR